MLINVVIEPISPYMQNRMPDGYDGGRGTKSIAKTNRLPRDVATEAAYINEEGNCFIPSEHIYGAFVSAARNTKIGKRSAAWVAPAAIQVFPLQIVIGKTFEVDSRTAVNSSGGPSKKLRIVVHRPRYDAYKAAFTINLDESLMNIDDCHKILCDAGNQVGIGSYRVDQKGPFGRFRVVLWEKVEDHPLNRETV